MNDNESDGDSNQSANPAGDAMAAAQNAAVDLAEAHASADNAGEAGAKETEIVGRFVDTVAQALIDGMNKPVGIFAGIVSDEAVYYNKTDLKQQVMNTVEELRSSDKQPLDEFIEERLETVTVVRTTDHRQGAEYIWDFGTFKVETRSGKDGRGHFAFGQFRDYLHESGGVNTAKPVQDRRGGDEWRDFMIDMIDERGETVETRGRRTKAYEALSNKIKRLTGYGTAEGALDHTGVWIIRDAVDIPDWWADIPAEPLDPSDDRDLPSELVNEVRVHESVIEPILEDCEITRSALYHELSARGHTIPGTSGASMTEWVNGSDERFWTLLPSVGSPRRYVPDPNHAVTTTQGSALVGTEQIEEQETAASEPTTAAGSDGQSGSDGFDSVGDTA